MSTPCLSSTPVVNPPTITAGLTGCPDGLVQVGDRIVLTGTPTDTSGVYTYQWERLSPNPATFQTTTNPEFYFNVQAGNAGDLMSFFVTVCEVATGACDKSEPCTFDVNPNTAQLGVTLSGCPTANLNVGDPLNLVANVTNATGVVTYTYQRLQPFPNTFPTDNNSNLDLNIADRNAGETMIFQVEVCDDNGCAIATCEFDVNPEVVNEDYIHPTLATEVVALPDLQGCGVATTTGGRGGEVRFVTNRNDSGPGSFRDAVAGNTPKNIVFLVGGDMGVSSGTTDVGNNTSIWGQTAPCEGVSLTAIQDNSFGGHMAELGANVISTHMRYRNLPPTNNLASRDTLRIGGSNVILFRNSVSWSLDELIDSNSSRQNVLIRENLFYEGLGESQHNNGYHSMGSLLFGSRFTIQHNLWHSCWGRSPRFAINGYDAANNWSHNYGYQGYSLISPSRGNIRNCLVTAGPDTFASLNHIQHDGDSLFTSGCIDENGDPCDVNGNSSNNVVNSPYTDCPPIDILPVNQVRAFITATAGARTTIDGRDANDARIVAEANAGTGQTPDCINGRQATGVNNNCAKSVTYNGLQNCNSNPLVDTNQVDGVPNTWKVACGGAALHGNNYDTTQQDSNGDGYTDFEDWIVDSFGL